MYNELQTKWFGGGLRASVGVGTIVNDDFNTPPTVTITITGENDAPVLIGVASNHDDVCDASASKVVTISGSFSDIDTSDTHTATVNWGDGMISTVAVNQLANTLAGSHTYQNGGIYTVTITVTDDNEKDDLFGEQGNDYLHYGIGDKRMN